MSSNKSFSSETIERYAKAIFELSCEKNELDLVEKSLKELLNIYKSNSNFENFIKNPTQSFSNQLVIIKNISELMN
ncbi:F0F1 ATP synthase subunit delta, partial [Pelagibacteraceae bacterium]|nr:F0F1 ATP synthase subunit delta [Pelagibacteraceae bacterium]